MAVTAIRIRIRVYGVDESISIPVKWLDPTAYRHNLVRTCREFAVGVQTNLRIYWRVGVIADEEILPGQDAASIIILRRPEAA